MKQTIKIELLDNNTGQIKGLPENPRYIKDEKFEKLKQSLSDDPEMLELRELIVIPHGKRYVVIAGNMRLRAAKELGFTELPCKVIAADTDEKSLRAITQKDNISYGNFDWDMLANEWQLEELEHWGMDIPDIGSDEEDEPNTGSVLSKKLIIECGELNKLEELYEEMQNRGFVVSLK